MREIGGVLCDLDGTLIDSEDVHFEAWKALLQRYGHVAREGWNESLIGLPDVEAARSLKAEYPALAANNDLLGGKQAIFRDRIRTKGTALVFPGVTERLDELRRAGKKLAVGTNSILRNTRLCLDVGGILEYFQSIAALDMVADGKPAPDIYLHAAAGLGVSPADCAVIEDSPAGIASGRAAGCLVLGVATTFPPDRLTGADMVFADTPSALDWTLGRGRQ